MTEKSASPTPGRPRDLPSTEQIDSATIDRLRHALVAAPASADRTLEDFWTRVADAGTPLVEELAGDPDHRAVTFLWRGAQETTRVLLLANRIGDRSRRVDSLLRQLPGTDVWHLTYRLRADHRCGYQIAVDQRPQTDLTPEQLEDELAALARAGIPDPLALNSIPTRWSGSPCSVMVLPGAPKERWTQLAGGTPGSVDAVRWQGTAGIAPRDVHRYRAPGAGVQPVLMLCDGEMWFERLGLPAILDRLVAAGQLAPLSVIAPSAVDRPTRWHDLAGNQTYVDALVNQLPRLAAELGPVDSGRVLVAGQSLGGLTALLAAAHHPSRVSGVIAQSPSLWWNPAAGPGFRRVDAGENPWVAELLKESEPADIRFRIAVGAHEGVMVDHAAAVTDTLIRRGAAGPVISIYNGGHDFACWRIELVDGLVALLPTADA